MDFSMNLLRPKSYYSPYNSGYEGDIWRCAWCNKTISLSELDTEIAEWNKIIDEFTIYDNNIKKELEYMQWCSGCKQLTGTCCTSAENGCAFDDYYARFISSVNQIPGSPIIPISKAKEFIQMLLENKIKIEFWCACPGFCPQYSVCGEDRPDGFIPWRDEWCCKYDKFIWKRVHTKYHTKISKGKTRREMADWAKSNVIKWPHSDEVFTQMIN